jgi:hypothetical protein
MRAPSAICEARESTSPWAAREMPQEWGDAPRPRRGGCRSGRGVGRSGGTVPPGVRAGLIVGEHPLEGQAHQVARRRPDKRNSAYRDRAERQPCGRLPDVGGARALDTERRERVQAPGSDGRQSAQGRRRGCVRLLFKVVRVFAYEQTDGEPRPELPRSALAPTPNERSFDRLHTVGAALRPRVLDIAGRPGAMVAPAEAVAA